MTGIVVSRRSRQSAGTGTNLGCSRVMRASGSCRRLVPLHQQQHVLLRTESRSTNSAISLSSSASSGPSRRVGSQIVRRTAPKPHPKRSPRSSAILPAPTAPPAHRARAPPPPLPLGLQTSTTHPPCSRPTKPTRPNPPAPRTPSSPRRARPSSAASARGRPPRTPSAPPAKPARRRCSTRSRSATGSPAGTSAARHRRRRRRPPVFLHQQQRSRRRARPAAVDGRRWGGTTAGEEEEEEGRGILAPRGRG